MRQSVYTMFKSNNRPFFAYGEQKIWYNIIKSQNIMKMIVSKIFLLLFMFLLRAKFVKKQSYLGQSLLNFLKIVLTQT